MDIKNFKGGEMVEREKGKGGEMGKGAEDGERLLNISYSFKNELL